MTLLYNTPLLATCVVAERHTVVRSIAVHIKGMHVCAAVMIKFIIIISAYPKFSYSHSLHPLTSPGIEWVENKIVCGWQRHGINTETIHATAVLNFCVGIVSAIRNHPAHIVEINKVISIIPIN